MRHSLDYQTPPRAGDNLCVVHNPNCCLWQYLWDFSDSWAIQTLNSWAKLCVGVPGYGLFFLKICLGKKIMIFIKNSRCCIAQQFWLLQLWDLAFWHFCSVSHSKKCTEQGWSPRVCDPRGINSGRVSLVHPELGSQSSHRHVQNTNPFWAGQEPNSTQDFTTQGEISGF